MAARRDYRKYDFNSLDDIAINSQLSTLNESLEGTKDERILRLSLALNRVQPQNIVSAMVNIIVNTDQRVPFYSLISLQNMNVGQLHNIALQNGFNLDLRNLHSVFINTARQLSSRHQLYLDDYNIVTSLWFNIYERDSASFLNTVHQITRLDFPSGSNAFGVIRYLIENNISTNQTVLNQPAEHLSIDQSIDQSIDLADELSYALPNHVPYESIGRLASDIARYRDIDTQEGNVAEILRAYDEIYPSWSINTLNKYNSGSTLTNSQKFYIASLYGLNANEFDYGIKWSKIAKPVPALNISAMARSKYSKSTNIETVLSSVIGHNVSIPSVKSYLNSLLGNRAERHFNSVEVNDLINYPPNISIKEYLELRKTSSYLLKRLLKIANFDNYETLSIDDMIFILSRGRIKSYDILRFIRRYNFLNGLPEPARNAIIILYHVGLGDISKLPLNPFEAYITEANNEASIDSLARKVGMIIPPEQIKETYYFSNINEYRLLLDKQPVKTDLNTLSVKMASSRRIILRDYSDVMIFNTIQAYFNYDSRANLLENALNLFTNNGFFVPLHRNCRNDETLDLENTNDPNVFIIAYGTVTEYTCYELSDYIGSISSSEELPHPEANNRNSIHYQKLFSFEEVQKLLKLANSFANKIPPTEIIELENLVTSIAATIIERDNYSSEIYDIYKNFDGTEKTAFEEAIMKIFETGMYMRQWRGPGHPYPLKTNQTLAIGNNANDRLETPQTEIGINVTISYNALRDILQSTTGRVRNLFNGLNIMGIHRHTREYYKRGGTFGEILSQVINGTYCIRMASIRFAVSGYYYMEQVVGKPIAGMHPSQLDSVI